VLHREPDVRTREVEKIERDAVHVQLPNRIARNRGGTRCFPFELIGGNGVLTYGPKIALPLANAITI
jgi:hypothetical protein